MRLSFMKGPLLKDLAKHMYDLKFNVRIDRIWEHWSVNSSTLYGLNFVMVDRKPKKLVFVGRNGTGNYTKR